MASKNPWNKNACVFLSIPSGALPMGDGWYVRLSVGNFRVLWNKCQENSWNVKVAVQKPGSVPMLWRAAWVSDGQFHWFLERESMVNIWFPLNTWFCQPLVILLGSFRSFFFVGLVDLFWIPLSFQDLCLQPSHVDETQSAHNESLLGCDGWNHFWLDHSWLHSPKCNMEPQKWWLGRLLSFLGWSRYIFRGYVKLPGGILFWTTLGGFEEKTPWMKETSKGVTPGP